MEYNSSNSANNSRGCAYNQLGTYTSGYSMGVANAGKPTSGAYTVPVFGGMSYNTLAGSGSCSGYGSIMTAYGVGANGQCAQRYTTSLCNSPN